MKLIMYSVKSSGSAKVCFEWSFSLYLNQSRRAHMSTEKKEYAVLDLSFKLVYYISDRILAGQELCRDPDYRAAMEAFSRSNIIFGSLWGFLPLGRLRRPFYWLTSAFYRWQIRRAIRRFLIPVIQTRMARKQDDSKTDAVQPLDTIQLMIDMPPASSEETDPLRHAFRIFHLHLAGTGPTIGLFHNAIYRILQHPECLTPIRDEIREVLHHFGGWEDVNTLNHLHLLDSFVREVMRCHVSMARKFAPSFFFLVRQIGVLPP